MTDDAWTRVAAVPGTQARTFPIPEAKILFVSLNKNACTSLKWMVAGIAGEDPTSFDAELLPVVSPPDAIHNRRAWKRTPTLSQLDPDVRAAIDPDNGWFVFAAVRDPRKRVFSAWQNKLLLENPGYTRWRDDPWYPRHPATAQSVVEDFERFVSLIENDPGHRLRSHDPHFRDQADLLMPDLVRYTRIYDIAELSTLVADLRAHLDKVGYQAPVELPRANDTPLPVIGAPFAGGVRERVERIYAADFALFPDRWDFADVEAAPMWTAAQLQEADLHAAYGRRIGDLRERAVQYRTRAEKQSKRADEATARADALQRRVDPPAAIGEARQNTSVARSTTQPTMSTPVRAAVLRRLGTLRARVTRQHR